MNKILLRWTIPSIAAVAALLTPLSSAFALSADLDDTGGKFYILGNAGYAWQKQKLDYTLAASTTSVSSFSPTTPWLGSGTISTTAPTTASIKTTQAGWAFGVGAGYNINCISIEGQFGYTNFGGVNGDTWASGATSTMTGTAMDIMANFYYRIKNSSILEPFAFAGVGAAFNSLEFKDNFYLSAVAGTTPQTAKAGDGMKISGIFNKIPNTTSFKFNVGAGGSFILSKNIAVDATYIFSNTGGLNAENITKENAAYTDGGSAGSILQTTYTKISVDSTADYRHTVKIGLRFLIG